ncbi:DUF1903-domain-containing protein [Dendrothele bispora CBS 962.96]|uniref:Cx9C motif-containing protein 4, mitochondrial n=1 Tax=Dendrothele bispora (strain CBS 962.96) TaxID=1314807 RepID=A0A4S8LNZ8_DENBC|nr:DUF1903-domain-containing protein [Dendrothele bispora CBS 962.96]
MSQNTDTSHCQAQACDLQSCLNKNTYKPEKCDAHLRNLYLCCQKMYQDSDGKAESTACPIPNVVSRWLKDHPK